MSRRAQRRFPIRQTALSDRIHLAPAADESWRPDANWREWTAWLQPATAATYQALRRSCAGRQRFKSLEALASEVGVWSRTLQTILGEMEEPFRLVRLERSRKGTIIAIEVNDPSPVPEDMPAPLRGLAYNTPSPPSDAEASRWVNYWARKWKDRKGSDYMVRGRDRKKAKEMLAVHGLDRLKRMVWWVLADPHHEVEDEVIRRSELCIGTFHARIDQIAATWHEAERVRGIEERLKEKQRADRAALLARRS